MSGRVMSAEVVKLESATTVSGDRMRISTDGGTVRVDDAKVVKADIAASNGVIT